MNRDEIFVLAGWSSNREGGCLEEFHDPLFHLAYKRANELKDLFINIDHRPLDHSARVSVQVSVDLQTSILSYDVSGCCPHYEAIVHKIIQELNHFMFDGHRVRLNSTYRQTIEQFMNGFISNLPPVYEYGSDNED